MIQINELRIGNYITTPLGIDAVFSIRKIDGEIDVNTFYDEEIHPISLTKEWLEKLGFEFKNNSNQYGWYKDVLNRQFCWCYSEFVSIEFKARQMDEFQDTIMDIKCKYIHQLQNIYFALTGEELEIK